MGAGEELSAAGSREEARPLAVTYSAPFETLLEGYARALGRFEAVAFEAVPTSETYIALFEALSWASTLAHRVKPGTKPDVLRAVEFARNAVHHDWAAAVYHVEQGGYGEGAYGAGVYGVRHVWHWRPVESLEITQGDEDREPLYRALLAGRPAIDALRELAGYFPTAERRR